MTTKQIVIALAAIFTPRSHLWDISTGHTKEESFILIRMAGLKKAHTVRLHNLVEELIAEDLGEGERE